MGILLERKHGKRKETIMLLSYTISELKRFLGDTINSEYKPSIQLFCEGTKSKCLVVKRKHLEKFIEFVEREDLNSRIFTYIKGTTTKVVTIIHFNEDDFSLKEIEEIKHLRVDEVFRLGDSELILRIR